MKVTTIEEKLRLMELLKQQTDILDDWDGYGAAKPTKEAIEGAEFVINSCETYGWLSPNIFPSPCGGIQFEWDSEGCSIELYVRSPKSIDILVEGDELESLWDNERARTYEDFIDKLTSIS